MIRPLSRSIAVKTGVLTLAFIAVPLVLAGQFLHAEAAKRATLLRTVQAESHLIAEGMRIAMERGNHPPSIVEMRAIIERIDARGINMRLLLRPASDHNTVYLIAASPPVPPEQLDAERKTLAEAGIVAQIPASCDGALPLDLRYTTAAHAEEVMSSITPFASPAGCWAVITSHAATDAVGSLLGRPYWKAPEVELAAGIYALLAAGSITLFAGMWRGLVRFGRKAQSIGAGHDGASFAEGNKIPELAEVASEFDRMVKSLRGSAQAIRQAAEDNAHALKTPIATIAQSIEVVRQSLAEDDSRGQRSLHLIEQSTLRLDALVTAARRMDEANAGLINPPHDRINLSKLLGTLLANYTEIAAEHGVTLESDITPGCTVLAGAELLETVIENILDNALSFSPVESTIGIRLGRVENGMELLVEDHGPGAPLEILASMFDRYVSHRPSTVKTPGDQHFGIGLWVVRRNVECIGGRVEAENRGSGGLRMTVWLPAAG